MRTTTSNIRWSTLMGQVQLRYDLEFLDCWTLRVWNVSLSDVSIPDNPCLRIPRCFSLSAALSLRLWTGKPIVFVVILVVCQSLSKSLILGSKVSIHSLFFHLDPSSALKSLFMSSEGPTVQWPFTAKSANPTWFARPRRASVKRDKCS